MSLLGPCAISFQALWANTCTLINRILLTLSSKVRFTGHKVLVSLPETFQESGP